MQYQMRLDYVTANMPATYDLEDYCKVLAGSNDVFCWHKCGSSDGSAFVSPLGLYFLPNSGWLDQRCLRFSGVGCEKFGLTLPEFASSFSPTFSRLDFAVDVLMSKADWRKFISEAFSASLVSDRKLKKYSLAGSGEAMTVYIGSRRGSKYFRIYNKTLEDPSYQMEDFEGNVINVSDDDYVIRYEVELKRFKRSFSDRDAIIYDPSDLFYLYFSSDPMDREQLISLIIGYWKSYCTDALFPSDWENSEFFLRSAKQSKNFVQSCYDDPCQSVVEQLHEYPHTFEHSLQYVVDKYGAYLPYILQNKFFWNLCLQSCKLKFGFVPDQVYYFENEFSDLVEPQPDNPFNDPEFDTFVDVPIDGFI